MNKNNVLSIFVEGCNKLTATIIKYMIFYGNTPVSQIETYNDEDFIKVVRDLYEDISNVIEIMNQVVEYMDFDMEVVKAFRRIKRLEFDLGNQFDKKGEN